jgi:hypothetical protein
MLFDLSIALRLHHDLYKVAAPTPRSGAYETWVPLGPHPPGSRSSQTHRHISGPHRPNWQPTRPPENLPKDSPDDLVETRRQLGVQDKEVHAD